MPDFSQISAVLGGRSQFRKAYNYTDLRISPHPPPRECLPPVCLCERLPRTPFRGLWVCVWPRERALKRTNEPAPPCSRSRGARAQRIKMAPARGRVVGEFKSSHLT
jgi:hypothetical protein